MHSMRHVWLLVLAALIAPACAPATGSERGACYPNGTCDPGLRCASNLCVRLDSDGGVDDIVATDAPADANANPDANATPDASADVADVVQPADVAPATHIGWVPCALQGRTCSFTGTRRVLYGTFPDDRFVIQTLTNGTPCTTAVFGDPTGVPSWEEKFCWYEGDVTNPVSAVPSESMNINLDLTPPRAVPYDSDRRQPQQGQGPIPASDGVGAFREPCMYSHFSFDDPIVFPGQPGRAHLHVFFGNDSADAFSTVSSLATTGGTTCAGGTLNRTAYWAPAIIDMRTGAPVRPRSILTYYKTGYNGIASAAIRAVPAGLRMIAGNQTARSQAEAVGRYSCVSPSGTSTAWQPSIPNCAMGDDMIMNVEFPQCWDGVNLDSLDHKSHMAFPMGGGCPATHPVPIPAITYNLHYLVREAGAPLSWRLSSDHYDPSLPGGYSGHGDYFFGWNQSVMDTFITNCVQTSTDCHAYLLGDGTMLF